MDRKRKRPRPRGRLRSRTVGSAGHVRHNRAVWDRVSVGYDHRHARVLGGSSATAWGVFRVPESQMVLLGNTRRKTILELGCGAARWSIALARGGARPTGLDLSSVQLAKARELQRESHVRFPLVRASAERLPFRDAAFDLVFCDWGAMTFADPMRRCPNAPGFSAAEGGSCSRPRARFVTSRSTSRRTDNLADCYDRISGATASTWGATRPSSSSSRTEPGLTCSGGTVSAWNDWWKRVRAPGSDRRTSLGPIPTGAGPGRSRRSGSCARNERPLGPDARPRAFLRSARRGGATGAREFMTAHSLARSWSRIFGRSRPRSTART